MRGDRLGLGLIAAILIATIFGTLRHGVSVAPALSSDLRVEGVTGDWRLTRGALLYDLPAYLAQKAHGELVGRLPGEPDLLAVLIDRAIRGAADPADTSSDDAVNDADEAAAIRDQAARARALLHASLALAPADAYSWTDLARAEFRLGNIEQAGAALLRSWRLAPFNAGLASERLVLADQLLPALDAPADGMIAALRRDIAVMTRSNPRGLKELMEESPFLSDLGD